MTMTNSNPAITERPIWFVTGCSTGLGRERAKDVLECGYRTVVTARSPDEVQDLAPPILHGSMDDPPYAKDILNCTGPETWSTLHDRYRQ